MVEWLLEQSGAAAGHIAHEVKIGDAPPCWDVFNLFSIRKYDVGSVDHALLPVDVPECRIVAGSKSNQSIAYQENGR